VFAQLPTYLICLLCTLKGVCAIPHLPCCCCAARQKHPERFPICHSPPMRCTVRALKHKSPAGRLPRQSSASPCSPPSCRAVPCQRQPPAPTAQHSTAAGTRNCLCHLRPPPPRVELAATPFNTLTPTLRHTVYPCQLPLLCLHRQRGLAGVGMGGEKCMCVKVCVCVQHTSCPFPASPLIRPADQPALFCLSVSCFPYA
jgi:hypothetical protein